MRKVACLLFCLVSAPASAHPLDEVVQAAYLTLAPNELHLQVDLIPGSQVAGVLLRSLDANADRRITEVEARAFAELVLSHSTLLVDGAPVAWRLAKVNTPPYENIELAGDTLEIHAVAKRIDEAGAHSISYENRYDPAACLCIANVFLEPGSGWRYRVTDQKRSDDGRRLSVSYTSGG